MKEKEIDKDKMGMESTCQSCGRPIIFTGQYWEHTKGTWRHPAVPDWEAVTQVSAKSMSGSSGSDKRGG